MSSPSHRMLELLGLFQLHRYWRGPDLASRLGVSLRTVRRDVERLRELGYGIESLPGVDGGYQMAAGSMLPPLVFTDDEALALAMGLRNVALGLDPETAEASVRALAKLSSIVPAPVRARLDLLERVTEIAAPDTAHGGRTTHPAVRVLGEVSQACEDGVRLRFGYLGAQAEGKPVARYVEPYRLVVRRRRWYLVAFDLDRDDWRTFRLDRMTEPAPARNRFTPRPLPADDLGEYVDGRINALRAQQHVEFEVALDVEAVRRTRPWLDAVALGPSRTLVTLTVDHLDDALFVALALDAPVTPRSNVFRDHLAARLAAITAALQR